MGLTEATNGMIGRIRNDLRIARSLLKNGVTPGSVLAFPLRRRWRNADNRIKLRDGFLISSPAGEELIHMFDEVWIQGRYLPEGAQLQQGSTVIDIGANVGVFTLWAVKQGAARVIAVEPSPRMCKYLARNISANHIANVTVLQAACSGRHGRATLYSRRSEGWNTLYSRDLLSSTFRPLCETEVLTLAEIFCRCNVEVCDMLKLDCEGAEYDVLLNAPDNVVCRIRMIAMEYHVGLNEHRPEELAAFLEARGFRTITMPLENLETGYLYASRV
jgi:FkbM family methyltransferase